MPGHIRVSGSWKQFDNISIRVGGSWKEVEKAYIRVGGAWKQFHTNLVLSPTANGAVRTVINGNCFAGVEFQSGGLENECNRFGSYIESQGNWLDNGDSANVWVERIITGGSPGTWNSLDPGTGRHRLNTTRQFRVSRTSSGIHTVIGRFEFWDAASGGNNIFSTSNVTWSAEFEFDPCPLCCFTPETLITLATGTMMPIGRILEGDEILVRHNGEDVAEKVSGVITRVNRPMYRLHFANGKYLDASDDHPFDVDGKAASLDNHGIEYKDLGFPEVLQVGDKVTGQDGIGHKIVGIEPIEYPGTVYTFENSLFYANGFLVY